MRKSISLLLVLVFIFSMSTVTAQAASAKLTGISDLGKAISEVHVYKDEVIYPGEAYTFVIDDILDYFDYDTAPTNSSELIKLLKTAKIKSSSRMGPVVVDSVKWNNAAMANGAANGDATITVTFVDKFVSKDDKDFRVGLYFDIDGKRTSGALTFILEGTFGNPVAEVFSDYTSVDTDSIYAIEAAEHVRGIEIFLGEGVYATMDLSQNQKLYARAERQHRDEDEFTGKDKELLEKYPTLHTIYTISSDGMRKNGNFIKIESVDQTYFVYGLNSDGSLKYLGGINEKLPFSDKYYVASEKLDIGETVDSVADEGEDTVPEDNAAPAPTTSNEGPTNSNDNPLTGK